MPVLPVTSGDYGPSIGAGIGVALSSFTCSRAFDVSIVIALDRNVKEYGK